MEQLRKSLRQIDGKGYPAYKSLQGDYQFANYKLVIEHVQGDPFAAPSKLRIEVAGTRAEFPKWMYDTKEKRVALQDYLLRRFYEQLSKYSHRAKGSGKSGSLFVSQPGQEILERSASQISESTGTVVIRMEAGFPANGRRINARELEKMLFEYLPECVSHGLFYKTQNRKKLEQFIQLSVDQKEIANQIKKRNLVAFVANHSMLPRQSGVSDTPMKNGIPFLSPKSMEVTLQLPYAGNITGMGIPNGVTLIVGGGYHGKSTVLKALERGIYSHIPGDGREYVVTQEDAMKIRAEDGRSICGTDISGFIHDLPNKKDTRQFYTEDASGSTSQAANVAEAMEAGSKTLLIDEDTSATNFMVRDELMQQVVCKEKEPIVPYVERIRQLYEEYEISTILVAGSSGSYFQMADTILQMDEYQAKDITVFAKEEARKYPEILELPETLRFPDIQRKPKATLRNDGRVKIKGMGCDGFLLNKELVNLSGVEQIVDGEQVQMLAQILFYLETNCFDGRKTLKECIESLYEQMEKKGISSLFGNQRLPGNLAIARKQELYACVNRYRSLQIYRD